MVGRRTCDQEVASSIPGQARLRTTTLGKLFTPNCLDADTLRVFVIVASLKLGTFTFTTYSNTRYLWNISMLPYTANCYTRILYFTLLQGKVFPYSLPSVGPGADPGVQAVSPQVT